MDLCDRLIFVSDSKKADFFESRLSNEIYLSNVSSSESIKYTSNFCIKYALTGSEGYLVDNKLYEIGTGQMLLIPHGREVETIYCHGDAVSAFLDAELFSDISISEARDWDEQRGNGSIGGFEFEPIITSRHLELKDLIDRLILTAKWSSNLTLHEDTYFSLAEGMLKTMNLISLDSSRIQKVKYSTRWEILKRLELVHSKILDDYSAKNSLEELAEEACMSKYNVLKYFKMVYGQTPKQLHIKTKIEKAYQMLQDKRETSVAEISNRLGYEDPAAFANQFKKIKGVAPTIARYS